MKNKILKSLCLGAAMVCSVSATAQNQTVKGTVVDENGEPVIGASVVIAGKQGQGVITDLDGNYTIQAPKGSKVTISDIRNNKKPVLPGGKVQLKQNSQNFDEVVFFG